MTRVEGLELKAESQKAGVGLRAGSCTQRSTLNTQHSRHGVTLIELLVVILIISILAALYPASRAARIDPVRALRHD